MGQVLRPAGRVGAGDQDRCRRLPLGTAMPGVAPRQSPLGDGHVRVLLASCGTGSVRFPSCSSDCLLHRKFPGRRAQTCSSASQRGSLSRGARDRGASFQVGPAPRAQPGAVRAAQRLERQFEHHRIAQNRLQVDQVAPQAGSPLFSRLAAGVDEEFLQVDSTRSSTADRQRTHSPCSWTSAVPVTRTPSTADSSRRSRSIGDPGHADDLDAEVHRGLDRRLYQLEGSRPTSQLVGVERQAPSAGPAHSSDRLFPVQRLLRRRANVRLYRPVSPESSQLLPAGSSGPGCHSSPRT